MGGELVGKEYVRGKDVGEEEKGGREKIEGQSVEEGGQ